MEGFKHYRIGSFARYPCVTTSFLKHYEDEGLISVVQQDNGYRYYPFSNTCGFIVTGSR